MRNIEEIEEDLLGEVERVVESRYHFLVKDHRLTFHGICQSCQEKRSVRLLEKNGLSYN